jgi:hypothetical protein
MRDTVAYHLAERIVQLEDAINTANKTLEKNGLLGVLPQAGNPAFGEASKFHARVRKILKNYGYS